LTADTSELLRDYLAEHPDAENPTAPLFPAFRLTPLPPANPTARRTGKGKPAPTDWRAVAARQATALAALGVGDAEGRLVLDWAEPLRHLGFYKSVFRPSVLRANRLHPHAGISPGLVFHSLRHTYVSMCVAAGIPPLQISRFVGHSKVTTTLGIYTHLFEDDHTAEMDKLRAMARPTPSTGNVIRLRG